MACDVPVVASNVGGLPGIIEDGVTGFVCQPDAIDNMADRSVALLTDAALRESITNAAVRLVRTRYCTEVVSLSMKRPTRGTPASVVGGVKLPGCRRYTPSRASASRGPRPLFRPLTADIIQLLRTLTPKTGSGRRWPAHGECAMWSRT